MPSPPKVPKEQTFARRALGTGPISGKAPKNPDLDVALRNAPAEEAKR